MLIAREEEQKILKEALEKEDAQFIAVYGRRRVGKTYLIRECLGQHFVFSHSGVYKGTFSEQLEAFSQSLDSYNFKSFEKPNNWLEAFYLLKQLIDKSNKKKKVVFLDEISWMATQNSGFVKALEFFWNNFVSAMKNVVFIVCGSATSWILSKIINNKGGLYNRLTYRINLKPFSLKELFRFVNANKLNFTKKQIVEGYMIFGGIPYYWGLMKKDLSLPSNVDFLFASKNAPLKNEYEYLYRAIFDQPEPYIKIISALASGKKAGLDYYDLLKISGESDNGNFSNKIKELEECGFVRKYTPFGKKSRGTLIQLIDNFTLFYHKFLTPFPNDEHFFSNSLESSKWKAWSGLAFERVCLQHESQIKEVLGIRGVKTDICSFKCQRDDEKQIYGSQIDLLIVRKDQVINLCEMKFSNKPYVITQDDVYKMEYRRSDLRTITGTDYAIIPTLVVAPSVHRNPYSDEFSSIIEIESLYN